MAALKQLVERVIPTSLKKKYKNYRELAVTLRATLQLARLRQKIWGQESGSAGKVMDHIVTITDGPNFYMQYKDEFFRRIYHFKARRPDPLILDGGSNIGMSILYFKHVYPQARVLAFEPDPVIYQILKKNVARNHLSDVTILNAGLSAQSGTAFFTSDGSAGGHVGTSPNGVTVQMHCLSDYLKEQVDFLKLNIEGDELPVLQEAAASGKLSNVQEMVLEYHGWPMGEQRLGDILNLLRDQGFRYLVHDFDNETCPATKPPFRLTPHTTWFCLVYACRLDD
jgi:FkbM family methyltransferase